MNGSLRVLYLRGFFNSLGSLPIRKYLRAVFTFIPAFAAAII